jgi:hypothetical protein
VVRSSLFYLGLYEAYSLEDESRDLLDRISTYQPQRVHDKISMQKTKSTTLWIEGDILTWVYDSPKEYKDYQNCLWISGIGKPS